MNILSKSLENDIKSLIDKYQNEYFPTELLDKLSSLSNLIKENIILKNALKHDVFEIFCHSETLENEGKRLRNLLNIIYINRLQRIDHYLIEAKISISTYNSPIDDNIIDYNTFSLFTVRPKKKKKKLKYNDIVINYKYEELTTGNGSKREEDISVIESPCKVISLSISVSHSSGIVNIPLIKFKLLSAGESPSQIRKLMDIYNNNNNNNIENNSKSDYFSLYIDLDSINMIGREWLGCTDEMLSDDLNFMLFLLSFNFVDDSWHIHEIIQQQLDREDEDEGDWEDVDEDDNE